MEHSRADKIVMEILLVNVFSFHLGLGPCTTWPEYYLECHNCNTVRPPNPTTFPRLFWSSTKQGGCMEAITFCRD